MDKQQAEFKRNLPKKAAHTRNSHPHTFEEKMSANPATKTKYPSTRDKKNGAHKTFFLTKNKKVVGWECYVFRL
jgi:hypothetical protein